MHVAAVTAAVSAGVVQMDAHIVERATRLASADRIKAAAVAKPEGSAARAAIRKAAQTIGAMHSSSPVRIDGPTPERLVHAGRELVVGAAVRSVEVVRGGQPQTEQICVARARVDQDPFSRMVQRGQLDPESEDCNRWLGEAGMRYRRLHEKAGRQTLQGIDPTKGYTTARLGASVVLDKLLDNWDGWDKANQAMHPCHRRVVDAIVLNGAKPEDVGAEISGYAAGKKSVVAAMVLLRFGLQDLDRHFATVGAEGA